MEQPENNRDVQFLDDAIVLPRRQLSIPYDSIRNIRISVGPALSFGWYILIYSLLWLTITYGFMFSTGSFEWRFIMLVIADLRVFGVIVGLGLLALRPVYSVLPKKTIMKIQLDQSSLRIILPGDKDSREMQKGIRQLRKKVSSEKLSIDFE